MKHPSIVKGRFSCMHSISNPDLVFSEAEPPSISSSLISVPESPSDITPVDRCRIIELTKISDPRGNLTYIEGDNHIPFDIKRVYYLYDVPGGSSRGGHAHKELQQLIIAMSGSFDIVLDDGYKKKRFHLNRSYYGLYICPLIWRDIDNFSSGAVCLTLASAPYDENDYFRNYTDYMKVVKGA